MYKTSNQAKNKTMLNENMSLKTEKSLFQSLRKYLFDKPTELNKRKS